MVKGKNLNSSPPIAFFAKYQYIGRTIILFILYLGAASPPVGINAQETGSYTNFLTSSSPYCSIYQKDPLYNADKQVTVVSDLSYEEINTIADRFYNSYRTDFRLANDELKRFHKFVWCYDLISRLRFNRGVEHLPEQLEINELIDYIIQSRWYREFLVRKTENPAYEFMENHALQIIIVSHTAAHFFELPFPTFFCLLFQESKFDFKITSKTGAIGFGQLTSVGMKQIYQLRFVDTYEERLQACIRHLSNIYHDPFIIRYLKDLGYTPKFPKLRSFPSKTDFDFRAPKILTTKIIHAVSHELKKRGIAYWNNTAFLREMAKKLKAGNMLPERYAAIHAAYKKVLERKFYNELGNIFNTETNITYSAMLLRYYMDYEWKVYNKTIHLRPGVRALLAVAAYNQGQAGVIRFLDDLIDDFPKIDFSELTVNDIEDVFTTKRIYKANRGDLSKTREIKQHFERIKNCCCRFE